MINKIVKKFDVVQLLSWVWLCDPMDCSMPGSLVFHCLLFWSDSCPPSQWCYLTITSSVAHFSFCLQSFPASGSFLPISWLFASGDQNIGASAPASVLPMSIQGWFSSRLTGLISLLSVPSAAPTEMRGNVVVQSLSHVQFFVTPWMAAHQASLPFTISPSLLRLMFIESVMPSNHLVLCCPLLLPSIFPSIRVFSSE